MSATIIDVNIVEVTCWAANIGALPEWHTAHLEISLADPPLFAEPKRCPTLTAVGANIFGRLTAISGLRVYFPVYARTANGMLAEKELDRHVDGGFAPAVLRLVKQISSSLGRCGLGGLDIHFGLTPECRQILLLGAGTAGEMLSAWPDCPGERFST